MSEPARRHRVARPNKARAARRRNCAGAMGDNTGLFGVARQLTLLPHERVVDLFAGGAGASTGIAQALGRPVDVAVNHDDQAIAIHAANHPATHHYVESVFRVNCAQVTEGHPVGLLWASPDCTHHSRAKGGKPVSAKRRGLAWVVVRWARRCRPRVIMLENVTEFAEWGPLTKDEKPCPTRKGDTFRWWIKQLERCGYRVEYRTLRACDYGAPTIRERLFVIARRDGQPIVWPEPTHAPPNDARVARGQLQAYRGTDACIDWSIPCPSIFARKRPLVVNTLRRIARGFARFVLETPDPYLVPPAHAGAQITDGAHSERVAAFLVKHYGGPRQGINGCDLREPAGAITTQDHHALVTARLLREDQIDQATLPRATMVAAFIAPYYGSGSGETGRDIRQPAPTATTKARLQLVTVCIDAVTYVVIDIGMRMLTPRELYRIQGFPEGYIIDPVVGGKPMTKTAQIRMCGNSVPPVWAAALVHANLSEQAPLEVAA